MSSLSSSSSDIPNGKKSDNTSEETCGCEIPCVFCKIKRVAPKCLQPLATAKTALLCLSLASMLQQTTMSGLLSVCISTLEKRFELQSTESGMIASTLDLASVFALVIIFLIGENVHKPRWIGFGVFLAGIGSMLFAAPHFLASSYDFVEMEDHNFCGNVTEVDCSRTSIRNYRFVFVAAMAIVGLGSNSLYTYAITYLDENVKKKHSALYNGIYYALGGLGPAIGYLCGGAMLEIFTDISKGKEQIKIDSSSGLWIGAWWMGFLTAGMFLTVTSLPLMMLPRYIPGTAKHRENRNAEMHKNMMKSEKVQEKSALRVRLSMLHLLLQNKPFMLMTFGSTVNSAFIYGFNTFGAKYLESVFGLSAFHASALYGATALFAATGGQIVAGAVIARFALSVKGILKFMILCGIFSALCSLGFFVHCDDIEFAGGTIPYRNSTVMKAPLATCNQHCGCSSDKYDPVCSAGVKYFSPCYAGCTVQANETSFTNCSCLQSAEDFATADSCDRGWCRAMIGFEFIVFICFFSSILTMSPAIQVTLRCVPFNHRTLAMALQNAFVLGLGVLPGRILTGIVIDMACVMWSTECLDRGSCRAYRRWDLARNTALLLLAQTTVCVIFYVLVFKTYKPAESDDGLAGGSEEKVNDENTALADSAAEDLHSSQTRDGTSKLSSEKSA